MRLLLILATFTVFVLGLVMIFSTSSAEVLDLELARSTHASVARQIGYALAGCAIAVIVGHIGWHKLIDWSPYLFGIFIILLTLTLIPGIGKEVNGSRRWLGIGFITFQPSEFVKYVVPVFFIYRYLSRKKYDFRHFALDMVLCTIPIVLILVEPNNGTAAVVGSTLVMLCFLMRIPLKYWALPLMLCALVGGAFAWQLPYVSGRIKVYLNPELDIRGKGHQPRQAKIAAGSGKLFGKGAGNSLQKLSYLPKAQNDYIAAIYAEEFGFFGVLSLIICYTVIAFVGFTIAIRTEDPAAFYFASVITFLITFQAFLNLGVVSGILPSTGLNLPLFSQGGTSLLANLLGVSVLAGINPGHDRFSPCFSSSSTLS